VVSSDLSHYHPYDDAKELDTRCVKAMCSLDIGAMESQEACGKLPILALLHLAHQNGWQARLLIIATAATPRGTRATVLLATAPSLSSRRTGKLRGTGKKVIAGPGPPDPDLCGDQSGIVGI